MFLKSAAVDTLQGRAIQETNERWGRASGSEEGGIGEGATGATYSTLAGRKKRGRKGSGQFYIGIQVCKKKYAPFEIKRTT